MSYQEITGPLMASGYDKLGTQEAKSGMYVTERGGEQMISNWNGEHITGALTCNNAGGERRMPDKDNFNAVIDDEPTYAVRRLTLRECERLQGYFDDWTLIGEPREVDVDDYEIVREIEETDDDFEIVEKKVKVGSHKEIKYYWTDTNGKQHETVDSPRYKALGNSICLPFWRFLAQNISAQYDRPITVGSLFDGIGGFPKVFEEVNGKGTARWASEIEEFGIACTKQHFPEPEQ